MVTIVILNNFSVCNVTYRTNENLVKCDQNKLDMSDLEGMHPTIRLHYKHIKIDIRKKS